MQGTPSKSSYRPEIDGLRAFAIVAVIINHFNPELLPSGYLGVDIFFVISGFVITASVTRQPTKSFGNFLLSFYTRRIKRLVPALLFFSLITSVLSCVLNPSSANDLGLGIRALFGLSNLALYESATDYFAPSTELNVFTHTWSLGVEEQFYLLFPCLVWWSGVVHPISKGSKKLFFALGGLSVASLIAFIYLYPINQPAAYFLMPTRFWEIGSGCLLFLGLNTFKVGLHRLQQIPALLITAGLVSVLFTPSQFAIPATLAAVVLTALLITSLRSGTSGYALFTNQRVVALGLISYSLYLWHWSVLALSRWTIGIHWWSVPFQIGLMLFFAIASYRYIETPLRHSDWSPLPRQTIGYGIGALSCCAILLLVLASPNSPLLLKGINDIPMPSSLKNSDLSSNPACVVDGKKRPFTSHTFQDCTTPPKIQGRQTIWALGDSHIGHWQALFNRIHDEVGLGVHLIETPGTPFPMTQQKRLMERQMIYEEIKKRLHPGDTVAISRLFFDRKKSNPIMQDFSEWSEKVLALADELSIQGVNLVIIGPPPIFQVASIKLCRSTLWQNFRSDCSIDRSTISTFLNQVYRSLDTLSTSKKNVFVFNPFDLLCPPNQKQCSVLKDGSLAYSDKDHLNAYGSRSLYEPFIEFLRRHNLLFIKQ